MCLEEWFCPFTRDALNFQQPKTYAAPHHPAAVITAPRHAHRKSRVRSNNALTRKVYVTLVFPVCSMLLCCDQYS